MRTNPRPDNATVHFTQSSVISEQSSHWNSTVSLYPPRTCKNHITLTTQIVPVPTHHTIYAIKFDIFLTAFSKRQYYIEIHDLRIYNNEVKHLKHHI